MLFFKSDKKNLQRNILVENHTNYVITDLCCKLCQTLFSIVYIRNSIY